MGLGGGGTTTSVQSNVPWNANQLATVQNGAIDLAQSNPLQYYPNQSYAPPTSFQTTSLANQGNYYTNAGNVASGNVGNQQQDALTANQNLVNGGALNNPYTLNGMNVLQYLGTHNPVGDNNVNALGSIATQTNPWVAQLATNSTPGNSALTYYANGGLFNGANPLLSSLSQTGSNAPGTNVLGNIANGGAYGAVAPYAQSLAGLANGTAANDLARTANGDYLGQNPYLSGQYNAAADELTRNYMHATAPQTSSAAEAAGRFNSGGLGNAVSVNQRNLGDSLGNLASNLYGNAYQNERGLMNSAANNLGALQGNAYQNAGNLMSGATGQSAGAASSLGGLNLGGLQSASNLYGTLGGQAANAASGLNSTDQSGLSSALDAITKAANQGGALGILGQNSQTSALSSGLNSYLAGLGLQQNAIGQTPGLTQMGANDYSAANTAGQGLQQLSQQNIQDLMNRFYGTQQAPWKNLEQEAGIVGNAIQGTTSATNPFGTSPLQGIGQGLSAANSLNSLGGGGGLLGGLLGGSGGGAVTGAGGLADFGGGGAALGIPDVVGPALADLAPAAGFGFGTVICTELMRSRMMPRSWWVATARHDSYMPKWVKDGYHLWAVPSVRHMRNNPNSLWSKFLKKAFLTRSENIAAKAGIEGASRKVLGPVITMAMAPVCIALGLVCMVGNISTDYRNLYKKMETI